MRAVTLIEHIQRSQLMTKNRIANQHHATFEGMHHGFSETSDKICHPLIDHMEDVLHMVQIITRN